MIYTIGRREILSMGAVSKEAQEHKKQYNIEYAKKKYKRVPLDLTLEDYQELTNYCITNNLKINTFIKELIKEKISKNQ